ncbi:MAG: Tad domain-containing protein [Sphingorhabdus sp.]
MAKKPEINRVTGVLSRLCKDQAGNTIAILAAAVLPAIGIIGGGVDMSRIFLTRTSLQAACDAGALMGRRVMGNGGWDANNSLAETRALQLFDTNFENGVYGSKDLEREFTENGGNVTGTASVNLPMSLMAVFGIGEQPINVTCSAEMRIPASDIMFVFDTTGSMNCPDDGSTCNGGDNGGIEASNAKIKGLRTASSCFYEALAKQNITNVSAAACGETEDPGGATSDVRLRFGFVPYSVNVNVGKLLPLNYIANQWTYQSREATFEPRTDPNAYDPTYGSEGPITETNRNTTTSANTGWTNLSNNLNHPNGQQYSYIYTRAGQNTACVSGIPSVVTPSTGNLVYVSQSPANLTYPTNTVTKYYSRTNGTSTSEYQYVQTTQTTGGRNPRTTYHCQLQRRLTNQSSTQINYSSTTNVTWVYAPQFLHWTYKPTTFNVSGLKNTNNNNWNSNITLPIGDNGTNRSITWNGCIEERQTSRISDSDPSNDWDPIPAAALDMNIEQVPDISNPSTLWGPMLGSAIYTRNIRESDGDSVQTINTFQTSSNATNIWHSFSSNQYDANSIGEACPTQARLYQEMDANEFSSYLTSLDTGGNTYHDIGLLWGARLMAPEGIFSSITSDSDAWVERHMIFMTDGDTSASSSNYSAHGVHWWDRRQNSGTSAPNNTWIEANIDARTQAICKWVRNENITLWVVAFGRGVSEDTKTNLRNCATPGRYFEATDTTGLISKFKTIANQISALRLTQ